MTHAAGGLPEHRSRLALLALVAVVAISATGALRYYLRPPGNEGERLTKLAKIVGPHRLAAARLTGGFAYAPCKSVSSDTQLVRGLACDGPPATSWSSAEKLSKFAGDLRIGGENGPSAPEAHVAGLWNLVWGHADDAVANLREMVRREPLNARSLNDLAVALTASAKQHDDPSALIDAFVAADSAVRADSSLVEARFTHALLLEHLYLRTDAIAAWNLYLKVDGKSRWSDEARDHLATLQPHSDNAKQNQERLRRAVTASDSETIRSIVADSPFDARALMQKEIGAWGAAFAGRDTARAGEHLSFARAIANQSRAVTGDALESDAIAVIDRSLTGKDSARLRALAEGHALLAKGLELYDKTNLPAAKEELLKAQRLLANGASPMSGLSLLYAARAQLGPRQYDFVLGLLKALRDSTPRQYLTLRSVAAQYQGFAYDVSSDYVHARAAYDSALTENRTTREPGVSLRAGSWLAPLEDALRGREAGWRTRYGILAATPRYPSLLQPLYSVFSSAVEATVTEAPRLALRYSNEAVRIASRMSDSTTLTYALARRAEVLARLGQQEQANADISAALALARRVAKADGLEKLVADIKIVGAHITASSSPQRAEADLREVVGVYTAKKYARGLSSAYLYLAESRAGAGAIESARAAFDSATSLMQRQRATITSKAERAAFLDAARPLIDQIVAFHADNNGKDAFEFFERTRSRVLLEQLVDVRDQSADQQPVLTALQRRLTKNDVVLSYAVLPRELLLWIVTQSRFEQHRVPVTATALEELVGNFRQSLLDATPQQDTGSSERLYRLLVDSASRLQPGANLIVIPDRWLHFVPFVALRDPSTGRFVVRDHAVSYAPSATLLLSSLARPPERFSRLAKILAIGNPAFDRSAFQLPSLPASEQEASRIASLYADQSPLTGKDATDAAFERLAPAFDILHFAGHAVVAGDAPQLSHLVLASDGRSDGAVFSTEIARWKLSRTRLVILSGCNTADGKLSATEGTSSLARAFFAAGVHSVVSSLWAIEDDDTADFFTAFHSRLVRGDSPSVALRETQIKWLGDGPVPAHPIRSWASFQLFGG
jgi:CHAT domain-containing protein